MPRVHGNWLFRSPIKAWTKRLSALFACFSGPIHTKKFQSWDEAALACSGTNYLSNVLAEVVVEKTRIPFDSQSTPTLDPGAFRTISALAGVSRLDQLRVLDFGGAAGYHFYIARRVAGDNRQITWNVVETAPMVLAAKKLESEGLRFFFDIASASGNLDGIDLVFTSSAPEYCKEPLEEIRKLIQLRAEYLFITRTPWCDGVVDEIQIQESRLRDNGPGDLPPRIRGPNR